MMKYDCDYGILMARLGYTIIEHISFRIFLFQLGN